MAESMVDDCPICAKHRGEGPLVGEVVWADEHVVVSHRQVGDDGTTVLGYLFIESRRHAPTFDVLTEPEVVAVALAAWRAARGLRAELDAEFVFSAIIGRGVAHFHQHLFVRHRGTPREYSWMDFDDWPEAPRGGPAEVADLCTRLGRYMS